MTAKSAGTKKDYQLSHCFIERRKWETKSIFEKLSKSIGSGVKKGSAHLVIALYDRNLYHSI